MKLLYSPQISMRSYTDPPRWLLDEDAQLNKMMAYVQALPEDWQWYWLLPSGELPLKLGRLCSSHTPFHVMPLVDDTWPDNVLQHRFHFNMPLARNTLKECKPDIILCEVPEHIRPWKVAMQFEKLDIPIIAMFEHVDIYDETKVDRSLHGMLHEWQKQAHYYYDTRFESEGESPHGVWPGIFSPKEVDKRTQRRSLEGDPTVFFISRCSDNQRTHWQEFIEASNELYDEFPHRVWFANPNEAVEWEDLAMRCRAYEEHPFGQKALRRDQYLELLGWSHIVPILYPMEFIYSVGFCEAIVAGNLMVTENCASTTGLTYEKGHVKQGLARALQVPLSNHQLLNEVQLQWVIKHKSVEENIDIVERTILRFT
jgi:hypothetical protein